MKRFFYKSIALVLTICMLLPLSACQKATDKRGDTFDEFSADMMQFLLKDDYLSVELSFKNPTAVGLGNVPPTFGKKNMTEEEKAAYLDEVKTLINRMNAFDRGALTPQQQKTYDLLQWILADEDLSGEEDYAENPTAPNFGWQMESIILLGQIQFDDAEEVDQYLLLLEDMPRYVEELLAYQKKRAEAGFGMSKEQVALVAEECDTFINAGKDNVLIQSFEERIEGMEGLSKAQKEDYKKKNRDTVNQSCVPAYRSLKEGLEKICAEHPGVNGGLAQVEGGKEAYAKILRRYTMSEKTPEEIEKMLDDDMTDITGELIAIMTVDPDALERYMKMDFVSSDPAADVAMLEQKSKADFPALKKTVPYKVVDVQKSLQEVLQNPAFYIAPVMDAEEENSIFLNRASGSAATLTTLAHEGFPGHLYQINYAKQNGDDYLLQLLTPGGYSEGWGQYVEMYSLKYVCEDQNVAALAKLDNKISMVISCKADYGVNYLGWDRDTMKKELADYYELDDETSEWLYQMLIAAPGEYLKYYYTARSIEKLYDTAKEALGSQFADQAFHQAILQAVPTEEGLKKAVETYISENGGELQTDEALKPAA